MPTRIFLLATVIALATAVSDQVHSSGVSRDVVGQRDSIRVRIEARPASIRSRDTATVTVSVSRLGGGPVANANLLLKASGGILHTGMQEVSGTTNRSGVLTTTFTCGYQCIPIYTITAQATHAGMVSGQATATIRGAR